MYRVVWNLFWEVMERLEINWTFHTHSHKSVILIPIPKKIYKYLHICLTLCWNQNSKIPESFFGIICIVHFPVNQINRYERTFDFSTHEFIRSDQIVQVWNIKGFGTSLQVSEILFRRKTDFFGNLFLDTKYESKA